MSDYLTAAQVAAAVAVSGHATLDELAALFDCHRNRVRFLLQVAQDAGVVEIDQTRSRRPYRFVHTETRSRP